MGRADRVAPNPVVPSLAKLSGRSASIQRRQLLSAGKQALLSHIAFTAPGTEAAPQPSQEPRLGALDYAPKVVASKTQRNQRVTGLRIGQGAHVTGDKRGTAQPISGTQYIGAETAAGWRAGGPKVGHARTEAGQVVSGTLIRSAVRVTGDEAGGRVTITGEADQRAEDDVTTRASQGASPVAQFHRQASPHGSTVLGTNLGRAAGRMGSRDRARKPFVEVTETGLPITGSAVGRSVRLTGDEDGACRHVTGTQYLAPARRQTECGFMGGGTAPAEHIGADRPDPVTGGKVAVAKSWGGQRITGIDVEHDARVTGDAQGGCATLTGSQYQGLTTAERWCDPSVAGDAASVRVNRDATTSVTGNAARHDGLVTGAARGAAREITGTSYGRVDPPAVAPVADRVAHIDERFSITSPQRAAHLRAGPADPPSADRGGRITGSFAVGGGKVTGNLEFLGKRRGHDPAAKPAHQRVSGEGRVGGEGGPAGRVTGHSWADNRHVTGTEGTFASGRNPTERSGQPVTFAGARTFRGAERLPEPNQLVTGMFGSFSKTNARVTLSGGAQT